MTLLRVAFESGSPGDSKDPQRTDNKNGYYILEDTTLGKGLNPSFPRISCAFDVVVCWLNSVYVYI